MIGPQLRKLRHSKALKQSDVANMLGITRTAYTYYENDKRQPPPNILLQLADFYQVSIDYLSGRTCYPGNQPKKDSSEALLIHRYRYVDSRGKESLLDSALHEVRLREEAGKKTTDFYTFLHTKWDEEM